MYSCCACYYKSLMKTQFVLTCKIFQIENRALLDCSATNTLCVKMFRPQESCFFFLIFTLKHNMLNFLCIKGRSSFSVSRILYRWVKTNCSFMNGITCTLLSLFFHIVSNESGNRTSDKNTIVYCGGLQFKSQPEHSLY
jgi:hypothetical protein